MDSTTQKRYIVYLEVDLSVDASTEKAAAQIAMKYTEIISKVSLVDIDDVRVAFCEPVGVKRSARKHYAKKQR